MDLYVIEMCVTRKKPVDFMYVFDDGQHVKISNNGVFTFSTATMTEDEAITFVNSELKKWRVESPVNKKTVGRYTYYIIGNDFIEIKYRISKQEFGKDVHDSGYGV